MELTMTLWAFTYGVCFKETVNTITDFITKPLSNLLDLFFALLYLTGIYLSFYVATEISIIIEIIIAYAMGAFLSYSKNIYRYFRQTKT